MKISIPDSAVMYPESASGIRNAVIEGIESELSEVILNPSTTGSSGTSKLKLPPVYEAQLLKKNCTANKFVIYLPAKNNNAFMSNIKTKQKCQIKF
jgi:hypothetical protein